jgi:immune inhibitor A
VVRTALPSPVSGSGQWWSGSGDDYTAALTRSDLAVPAEGGTLSMSLAWNIEDGTDAAYVEVQPPGGSWTPLDLSALVPGGASGRLDGVSTTYRRASWDLAAYAGQTVGLRIRYATDGQGRGETSTVPWSGLLVDDVTLTSQGATVLADQAESGAGGWSASGFTLTGAQADVPYPRYYLASYRTYAGYDEHLEQGPYNYGWLPLSARRVEHFPYQDGLLVSLWDTSYADNNTSKHPGGGLILPFDADPRPIPGAGSLPGRIQLYDATFGLEDTDAFTLHSRGRAVRVRSHPGRAVFDDRRVNRYYQPSSALGRAELGLRTAGAGVRIEVVKQTPTSMTLKVS